jgi:hypothetical protein
VLCVVHVPSTVIVHVAQVPCLQLYLTGTPALAHTTLKGVPPAIKIFLLLTVKFTSTSCMHSTATCKAKANKAVRSTATASVLTCTGVQCLVVTNLLQL